jgi:hypothetical protein
MDEQLPPERSARLILQKMPHQSQVQASGEDWAGVTSTAERRKLQNRLNQRARSKSTTSTVGQQIPG